jgi:hypothetical protein
MSAMVNLEATIYKDRLLVPRDAILVRDTNRDLLFIIRDNLAKWSYVEIGHSNDEYVEIPWSKMELKAGELVITDGHYSLIHDAPVKVEEKE